MDRKGGALTAAILVILGLVIIFLVFFVPYAYQQHRINNLNDQINSLKSQINNRPGNYTPAVPNTPNSYGVAYTTSKGVKIYVYYPRANMKVISPMPVVGEVPGNWSFEASFPVKLTNSSGKTLAQTTAHVLGDWTTSNLVIFSAQLTFPTQTPGSGNLILEKDNPSGLAQNSDSVSVPINF